MDDAAETGALRAFWIVVAIAVLAPVIGLASIIGLLIWSGFTDDSMVVLVNRSGAAVAGTLTFPRPLHFALQPGERRRFTHTNGSEADFTVAARLPSGRLVSTEGPYHHSLDDGAFDGPDEETVALIDRDSIQVADVDEWSAKGDPGGVLRSAGYEPDTRTESPSGALEAVVRVGPSVIGERTWRVMVTPRGEKPLSGATVLEASDAGRLWVSWASDKDLVVHIERGRVAWLHPLATKWLAPLTTLVRTRVVRADS